MLCYSEVVLVFRADPGIEVSSFDPNTSNTSLLNPEPNHSSPPTFDSPGPFLDGRAELTAPVRWTG